MADIEAESTVDITNRGLLSEESDPRLNLKKWLEEKTFKDPDKIVELAEPIIAEAMKQSTTARFMACLSQYLLQFGITEITRKRALFL